MVRNTRHSTQNLSTPILEIFRKLGWDIRLITSVEEISKFVTTVWTYHDEWKTISDDGLESLLANKAIGLFLNVLSAGVSELAGEAASSPGIAASDPLGFLLNPFGKLQNILIDEISRAIPITYNAKDFDNLLNATPDAIRYQANIIKIAREEFKRLAKGNSVINAPDTRANTSALKELDPILLYRGEFERQSTDLVIKGAGIDFSLTRIYRSNVGSLGVFGPNWDHNYNIRLFENEDQSLTFKNGKLLQRNYLRHERYYEAAQFNYYVPPDGIHDAFKKVNDSFELLKPNGVIYSFEPTTELGKHRVKLIKDRFGNYLNFQYSSFNEDLLVKVEINHPERFVIFSYDSINRLENIEDHSGRKVSYSFDDYGLLDCVAGPFHLNGKPSKIESYEYDRIIGAGFKLGRVHDWKGQILVENEYNSDPLSEYFGYVVRQRENRGEAHLVYESVAENFDSSLSQYEIPDLRVWEYKKNGHQIEHLLNKFGHELLRKEKLVEGGIVKQITSLRKFNADGQIIAQIDPNGVLSQNLFGREEIVDRFELAKGIKHPDIGYFLDDITLSERLSFGNLLGQVIRAREINLGFGDYSPEIWNRIPSVKSFVSEDDIITKYIYYLDNQLIESKSDPRYTKSVDPLHVESAPPGTPNYDNGHPDYLQHQKHLIKYEYSLGPRFELKKTTYPNRSRPFALDGILELTGIEEEIKNYDAQGRPLETKDSRGYHQFFEYFSAAENEKEGFLKRKLIPHIDWALNESSPHILEIDYDPGEWNTQQHFLQSNGNPIKLIVKGVRLELHQSGELDRVIDPQNGNPEVRITIDGIESPIGWDQSQEASFVVIDLERGQHEVIIDDPSGRLFYVGRIRSYVAIDYEINNLGQVLKETDPNGNHTGFVLDVLGRQITTQRGEGNTIAIAHNKYDQSGFLVEEKVEWRDRNGILSEFESVIKENQYDKKGFLLTQSIGPEKGDERRVTRHKYDSEDNLCHTINPRGISNYFDFDVLNRQKRIIRASCSPDAVIDRFMYDIGGRLLASYNPRNILSLNGYQKNNSWISGYDSFGRVSIQTDGMGNLSIKDFDKSGNVLVDRFFWKNDDEDYTLLSRQEHEYDEHGSLVLSKEAVFEEGINTADPFDPALRDNEFLDHLNNLSLVQYAIVQYCLDQNGHSIAIQNPEGAVSSQVFDGQGKVFDSIDIEGNRSFVIFDESGQVKKNYIIEYIKNLQGQFDHFEYFIESYQYDVLNREIKKIDSFGNVWEKKYDSLGNVEQTIDPLGNTIESVFNAFGQEVMRIEHLTDTGLGNGRITESLQIQRVYDLNGNLLTIIDPADRRTQFRYDALNRQVETWFDISPDSPKEIQEYDSNSNLIRLIDRNGLIKNFEYDSLDRNERMDIDLSNVRDINKISDLSSRYTIFQYDGLGRMTGHENEYCVATLKFNSRGLNYEEIIEYRNVPDAPAQNFTIFRKFDIIGRLEKLTYPSGREVGYSYDSLGRLTSIENLVVPNNYPGIAAHIGGYSIANYQYSGSRLASISYGNGLNLDIVYEGRGLIVERRVEDGNTTLWRDQKIKDARGVTRLHSFSARNTADERSRKYYFDSTNRLVHYDDDNPNWIDPAPMLPPGEPFDPLALNRQNLVDGIIGTIEIPNLANNRLEYDEMGNRVSSDETTNPNLSYESNELNQYTEVGGTIWNYDLNGNLKDDSVHIFEYNFDNLLQETRDTVTNDMVASYFRNALGQVIVEKTSQMTSIFSLNGTSILSEKQFDPQGLYQQDEDFENTLDNKNSIIHFANNQEEYWVSKDSSRSLRLQTDSQKNIISIPTFLPFGQEDSNELARTEFRFTYGSMWKTRGTDLLHTQSRSYKSNIGRFLQRDPLGFTDHVNPYLYSRNNPLNRFDPSGLESDLIEDPIAGMVDPEEISYLGDPKDAGFDGTLLPEVPSWAVHAAVGTVLVVGGVVMVMTPVGWVAGTVGGLSMAAGGTALTFAGLEAGLDLTGNLTPSMEKDFQTAHDLTLFAGSPLSIVGGVTGMFATDTEDGLFVGSLIGGGLESIGGMALGIGRVARLEYKFHRLYGGGSYNWRHSSRLKPAIRESFGLGPRANFRENSLFPYNRRLGLNVEWEELSHFIPQRATKGFERFFNRPWNLKPMWATDHAMVDSYRFQFMKSGFKQIYGTERLSGLKGMLTNTPDWFREVGFGLNEWLKFKLKQSSFSGQKPSNVYWWRTE